jgi:RNA polymerase sigma factor (sigma-70 family)
MNKSIAQIQNEVSAARKNALSEPHRYERPDMVLGLSDEANSLTDIVASKEKGQRSTKQGMPDDLRGKVESIFEKFPHQYRLLGLYFAARFTMDEISEMIGYPKGHVSRDLNRAKTRLKKYLTNEEYDSIRWALGDAKTLQATPRVDDSEYENAKSRYAPFQSRPISDPLDVHPPAKNLPVPRIILWQEQQAIS